MSSGALFPACPSCGMNTLHPGESGGWTCWNCGAVPTDEEAFPPLAVEGATYPCRWCGRVATRLVSEPGRTPRGVWQVMACDACGAVHARYARER